MRKMIRRKRALADRFSAPGGTSLSHTPGFRGCRRLPDDDSLTRTRLASQEEQGTCFQLIEEGCERTSFGFAQKGQAIVIMEWNSSPGGKSSVACENRYFRLHAAMQEPLNHSAKYQECNSAEPAQCIGPHRFNFGREIKRLSVDAYLGGKRVTVTGSYSTVMPPDARRARVCLSQWVSSRLGKSDR